MESQPLLNENATSRFSVRRGLAFHYIAVALSGLSYGLFLPSIERYITSGTNKNPSGLGETETIYSIVIAIYSVGECLGGFLFGKLYQKFNMRTIWFLSFASAVVANLLYVFPNIATVTLARLLCGIWTGGISNVFRSYVVQVVPTEKITSTSAILTAVSTFCFAGSPAFAGVYSIVNATIIPNILYANEYTMPAWSLGGLCMLSFILVLVFCNDTLTPEQRASLKEARKETKLERSASKFSIGCVMFLMFTSTVGFSIIETMITPILADSWGVPLAQSSVPFIVAGLALFVTAVAVKLATIPMKSRNNKPLLSDRMLTLLSFVFLLIGSLLMTNFRTMLPDSCRQYDNNESACQKHSTCVWNPTYSGHDCSSCSEICWEKDDIMNYYQFIIGFCFSNAGFQMGRISIPAMISKIIPSSSVTFVTALLILFQGLSRIVAPLYAVAIYVQFNNTTFVLMTSLGIMYAISIGVHLIQYKRMDIAFYKKEGIDEATPLLIQGE